MATVSLKGIKKVYEKNVVAVQNFNLEIADKEFVVLVGPSGCGKSTTLRMVAGLEQITEGDLFIDGKRVNDTAAKDRDIAMVFQSYALYPHMTVYDNIAFGLKLRKVPKEEIDRQVRQAAEILDITELLKRKPKALSGGQRQRVAIGRAIVRAPKVFLMDEPLSNLDAKLRNQMRAEIIKLRQRIDTTFLYVTHDQTEAMTLGDRIVIMKDGHVQQVGTPSQVFDHPANLFVAGFIGAPQMNMFPAVLEREGGHYSVSVLGTRFILPEERQRTLLEHDVPGGEVTLGVRPEHLVICGGDAGGHSIPAVVDVFELMGSSVHIHVTCEGRDVVLVRLIQDAGEIARYRHDMPISFTFEGNRVHLFSKETGENLLPYEPARPAQNSLPADEKPIDKGTIG